MKNKHGDTEFRKKERNVKFFPLFSVPPCLCGFSKIYSAPISQGVRKMKLFSFCAFFVIVVLVLSGQGYAKIDPATCAGAWVFSDPSVDILSDISGNGNDCSIKGKPKWVDGQFGKAIDFDAVDDLIECPDNDMLDVGTANFSVSAWLNTIQVNGKHKLSINLILPHPDMVICLLFVEALMPPT
jgi:hypothetical protein